MNWNWNKVRQDVESAAFALMVCSLLFVGVFAGAIVGFAIEFLVIYIIGDYLPATLFCAMWGGIVAFYWILFTAVAAVHNPPVDRHSE